MCLAIPGEVVSVGADRPDAATVEVSGVRRVVNIGLLQDEGVAPGDWVLIHVGFAMAKVDEAEANAVLDMLRTLGQAYDDEIAALSDAPPGDG
jgi:hydrogenase expression/formation protein HypC